MYIYIYIHILIVLYFVQILICLKPPILMNIGRISGELRWIWGRIILERKFRRDQENFEGGTSKMAWNTCPHLCQSLESLIHQTWFIFAQKPILMLCTSEIRHILPSPSGFGEVIGSPICWDPS